MGIVYIVEIFVLVLFAVPLPGTIKNYVTAMKYCSEIRQIHQCPVLGIRIIDMQHDAFKKTGIIMIVKYSALILVLAYVFFQWDNPFIISAGLVCGLILSILALPWIIFRLCFGKKAYLTYEGVITATQFFRKDQCQFTISTEKHGDLERKYIFVYPQKEKEKGPFRFQIAEREEECLKWIQSW